MIVLKSIVGLFLALVFQLSQMPSALAGQPQQQCATQALAMSCCEGLGSCPCATESRENDKPAPLLPASLQLKFFISKAPEQPRLETFFSLPAGIQGGPASPAPCRGGYAGVPLSVAFCRFVI